MQSSPAPALAYRPELSGLRAVAVGVVVLHHWLRPAFPLGETGRSLFFVLSGYLVSGIIWKYRAWPGAPGAWRARLGTFYLRRVLRIVPPYYLALLGCALLPLATVRDHPAWFLLPGANLFFYRLHGWGDGVGHYWTLAVDEQFYLLWPLVLALVGRRLGPLLALAAGGWLFRVAWAAAYGPAMVHLLLPASLDLLALGAVLRLGQHTPWLARLGRGRYAALAWAAWVGLTLAFGNGTGRAATAWDLSYVSGGAVAAFLTLAWLLQTPGAGRRLGLTHPLAQWVGQRSYGFYLYHLPLLVAWQRLVYHLVPDAAGRHFWLSPLPVLLALGPLLALGAAASWHFVEAPFERLKERFAYEKP